MSATNNPYGFIPCGYLYGGTPVMMLTGTPGSISAAYASNIFENQIVAWGSGGTIAPVTVAGACIGTFSNVQFTPTSGNIPMWNNWWTASVPFVAGSLTAFFTQDPNVLYRVQADGPIASTAIGDQADASNFTAGSTATGKSASTLSATLKGTGVQGMFRIISLWNSPTNAWSDVDSTLGAYTEVVVQIAQFQYGYPQTAI